MNLLAIRAGRELRENHVQPLHFMHGKTEAQVFVMSWTVCGLLAKKEGAWR